MLGKDLECTGMQWNCDETGTWTLHIADLKTECCHTLCLPPWEDGRHTALDDYLRHHKYINPIMIQYTQMIQTCAVGAGCLMFV